MDHPDMALPIDGDAADLAEDPVVRQRLWPGRVDREGRDVAGNCRLGKGRECNGRGEKAAEQSCRAGATWRRLHQILPFLTAVLIRLEGSQSRGWRGVNCYSVRVKAHQFAR